MVLDTAVAFDYLQHNWAAFAAGAIITRPVLCADITVKIVMRTPLKHLLTKKTRATINEWIDTFQAEVNKQAAAVESEDLSPALPPALSPTPAPIPAPAPAAPEPAPGTSPTPPAP